MTRSALDAFVSASYALRRLTNSFRTADSDGLRSEMSALSLRFPEFFDDKHNPLAGLPEEFLNALALASTRIALGMTNNLVNHGREQYRTGRYRDATRVFGLVLVIDPSSATATMMHASALELSHPRAPFQGPARRATVLAPLSADGWKLAMHGSLADGNHIGAQDRARRHLMLSPNSHDGWLTLARACFLGGQPEEALAHIRHARTMAPANLDIQTAQIRCLFRLGLFSEALLAVEKAANLGASGPEYDFEHARIARSAGRPDIATPLLAKLIAEHPSYRAKREILELTATTDNLRGKFV